MYVSLFVHMYETEGNLIYTFINDDNIVISVTWKSFN